MNQILSSSSAPTQETTNLLFLCGFPSSGTDLLKNTINAHSEVYINGEFPLLLNVASKYGSMVSASAVPDLVRELQGIDIHRNFENPNPQFEQERLHYSLAHVYGAMLNNKVVQWKGNKTPQNTENINRLKQVFPQAKFILIVRDIRDVALSWHKKWAKDKLLCAWKWNERMKRGYQSLQSLDEGDYLIVKYEDLLNDLENTTRRICEFLGLNFQQRLLEFYKYVDRKLDGKLNYGAPVIQSNTGKWKQQLTSAEIQRIEEVAFETLSLFEYPVSLATEAQSLNPLERISGRGRDLFALLFIGNRAIQDNRWRDRLELISLEIRKRLS